MYTHLLTVVGRAACVWSGVCGGYSCTHRSGTGVTCGGWVSTVAGWGVWGSWQFVLQWLCRELGFDNVNLAVGISKQLNTIQNTHYHFYNVRFIHRTMINENYIPIGLLLCSYMIFCNEIITRNLFFVRLFTPQQKIYLRLPTFPTGVSHLIVVVIIEHLRARVFSNMKASCSAPNWSSLQRHACAVENPPRRLCRYIAPLNPQEYHKFIPWIRLWKQSIQNIKKCSQWRIGRSESNDGFFISYG